MSLDFSFKRVRDWQDVTAHPFDEERWHPVADSLVWLSMSCGYNAITNRNADTVWRRIKELQLVRGPSLTIGGRPCYITSQDVVRFVGLSTNATPMTDKQWDARLVRIVREQADDPRPHGKEPSNSLVRGPSALEVIAAFVSKRKQDEAADAEADRKATT